MDPPGRSAVSLARRLQDPLAELVKIDPKSVGVGQYQHEVSGRSLKRGLDEVIESCVALVGVKLNTASELLLARVPGLSPAVARAILDYRRQHGPFATRAALREVPELGAKAFEHAVSFFRVPGSPVVLDETAIHPEWLPALTEALGRAGLALDAPGSDLAAALRQDAALAVTLGDATLADVAAELERRGKDPRGRFVPFSFRDDVREVKDLQEGMSCPGLVTNVTNFGAFVDVGAHHDGLVHVSQLGAKSGKDPKAAWKPGDRVQARVLKVDLEKKQISLTLRPPAERRPPKPKPRPPEKRAAARPPAARPVVEPKAGPEAVPPTQPRAPRPAGPRPDRGARPGRPPARPPAEKRPEPRRQAFNNPFAVLAGLKEPGKK
jgi:uncharacterized protein